MRSVVWCDAIALAVLLNIDHPEQSDAAPFTNAWVFGFEAVHFAAHDMAELGCILDQTFINHHIDDGFSGGSASA